MTTIEDIRIKKILDRIVNQTVEVEVLTENGYGFCAAPSGASTGKYEVVSYPENDIDLGIKNCDTFFHKIIGYDAHNQSEIDALLHEIDGTDNFSKMGGNISVALSLAVAKAAANALSLPLYEYLGGAIVNQLPLPLSNVLGGGRHAIGGTDIQEYLIVTFGKKINESVFSNAIVHKKVKELLVSKFPNNAIGKGDEGAWVAQIGNEEALELVARACNNISEQLGITIKPCMDMAASEFWKDNHYVYKEGKKDVDEQIEFVKYLVDQYDMYLVEDPLDQEDFEAYAKLTKKVGNKAIIVGDDIFVTNKMRLEQGIKMGSGNAILIKPNQIGTLTDTYETIKLAKENNYKTVISHRSGETTDNSIAHLGVAFGCDLIKTGIVGGERIAKLNELIRIEGELFDD